jgi:bifunctional non-homologous end joining protein LigD
VGAATLDIKLPGALELFPARLRPMLADLADGPFADPAWLFEPKLDGYRMLGLLRSGNATLISRRGLDYTRLFPRIAEELAAAASENCIVDGEIVALDARGKPSFNALQNRSALNSKAEIAAAEARAPAIFFCFDILHYAGHNLRNLPYTERRELLAQLLRTSAHIQRVHADPDGIALYPAALEQGFEGIVAKRKSSVYHAGRRTSSWLKIKLTSSAEFVIGGYSKGQGERERFGSIVAGYWDNAGKLRYAANVGTGYTSSRIDDLLARFEPLIAMRSPFADRVPARAGTVWLRPELVAEVAFAGWTEGAHLRAPVFMRLRDDIDPQSVRRTGASRARGATSASLAPMPVTIAGPNPRRKNKVAKTRETSNAGLLRVLSGLASGKQRQTLDVHGASVPVTNLDRVYWPADAELGQAAITKRDLIVYLIQVSPFMLPHVADRPLTLFRWPEGIAGRRVLQKHPKAALPAFVDHVTIYSETKASDDEYLLCNNLATLVWLAEMGALEIHVWHSRVSAGPDSPAARVVASASRRNLVDSIVNFPDYLLFDLDPYIYSGKEATGAEPELNEQAFDKGRQVALWLKDVLDRMRLKAFVKTSGKTGLHVVVPITRKLRFDAVRKVAEEISRYLLRAHADTITTEWDTAKRRGKVFMDYNMNVRGKSIIAPYAPRGLHAAPISMPLTWRELARSKPMDFRIPTLMARRKRADAWAMLRESKQDLELTLSRRA